MKVTFKKNTECWTDPINGTIEIDIYIPTASLIAELEKRRPCGKCCRNGGTKCAECFWHYALVTYSKKGMDNFKEIKHD